MRREGCSGEKRDGEKRGDDKTSVNHKQKGGLGVAGVGLGLRPMEAEV